MNEITIYTTRFCPYCIRAKMLLDAKQVSYHEIRVDQEPAKRQEMQAKGGGHTVPQIWIGSHYVGGCDELMQLEFQHQLDPIFKEQGIEPSQTLS